MNLPRRRPHVLVGCGTRPSTPALHCYDRGERGGPPTPCCEVSGGVEFPTTQQSKLSIQAKYWRAARAMNNREGYGTGTERFKGWGEGRAPAVDAPPAIFRNHSRKPVSTAEMTYSA